MHSPPMDCLKIAAALGAIAVAAPSGGCSSLPSGRGWGSGSTLQPGFDRIRQAAVLAARDPWVWAPAAGALAFQVDSFDRRTSDWAREHTPVFGSTANAERWSNDLRKTCNLAMAGTLIATPSGEGASEWFTNKLEGGAVELGAVAATALTTGILKDAAGRTRPNEADDESFPSGHASSAAVSCRLASVNLDSIAMNEGARLAFDIGLDATVIGTAWARVEAGAHYPSDVLVGMALGNFFGLFATAAFLDTSPRQAIQVAPLDGGARVSWSIRF